MSHPPELTHRQAMRYSRHVMLPALDFSGQERILASRMLVIGAGGLGCAALPYLASSGVGVITIVDDDDIEPHNLQRQTLYTEADIGKSKAKQAAKRLRAMNADIQVHSYDQHADPAWLTQHLPGYDVVLDCTDSLASRNAINQACVAQRTPLVSGAAIRFEGQLITFTMAPQTPCYACMSQRLGEQTLSCMEAGIFAPVVAQIGIMQALEALKLVAGLPVEAGVLLLFDGMHTSWQQFKVPHLRDCPVCATDR